MKNLLKSLFALCLLLNYLTINAQMPAYVPTSGLMGYWPFSGNANDLSGNGNHGTVNGASLTSDRFNSTNSAYNFNGSSNYISVPSSTTLAGYSNMSISAWINLNTLSGIQGVVTKWYQVSCTGSFANSDTYELATSSSSVQFATNNNNLTGFTSPPPLPGSSVNTWVHLVATSHSVQGMAIYINGTLSATHASTGGICNSINTLFFGADYHGTGNYFHRYLNGKIDDIGIWNRVLTTCEIQELYHGSFGTLHVLATPSVICLGDSSVLSVSGGSNYSWLGNANGDPVVVTPTSTTIYFVSASGAFPGCPAVSSQFAVVVNQPPAMSIISSNNPVCSGSSATLTASGAQSYTWASPPSNNSVVVVSPGVLTQYSVSGTSSAGCTGSVSIIQNVIPSPNLVLASTYTSICQGASVTLSASGAQNYTWQPGNSTGANITVTPTVSTVYSVIATNSTGCSANGTLGISVSSSLNILANANPSTVCAGNSVTLTATGASSYTWIPGNQSGTSSVIQPTVTTNYTVIGNSGACTSSTTVLVNVGLPISISSSGNLCNNSNVNLFVSPVSAGDIILWSGPGIVGSNNNSTITINSGGVYSVSVTNTLINCSGTASVTILSNLNPLSLTITPSSTFACFPGPPVNLLVSASANFSWFPPSEVSPNTGPLVSVSPSVTTTYTLLGVLGSCSGTAAITISVNATPTLTSLGTDTICAGKTATLIASGANDYFWEPGNLSGASVTVAPFSSVVYSVTGYNGNCFSKAVFPLLVNPSPFLSTSVLPNKICIGHTATLSATGAPLITWLIADPPVLSNFAIVNPTISTTYSVVGTNTFGCSSIASIGLNVINSFAINAISSSTSICAGESITLTASGATNYTWMPGFQVAPQIINTPGTSTEYTVRSDTTFCGYATVFILVNNCLNTNLGLTNIAEPPLQQGADFYKIRFIVTIKNTSKSSFINIELNDDLLATFLSPLTFTVLGAPEIRSKNSLLRSNSSFDGRSNLSLTEPANSILLPNVCDTLAFTVLVDPNGYHGTLNNSVIAFARDANNIIVSDSSNAGYDSDPDSDGNPTNNNIPTLIQIDLIDLFIPDGFSPDDDGINDQFTITGMNGRKAKLTIFNRWGNKVFFTEGSNLTWDGKANVNALGKDKLPASTYYYIFEFIEGDPLTMHGFIEMRY